ncbi:MAG: NADH-quinone oxidoreductase subunit NuoG [Acidobacteriota bacterium]
MPKIFIDGVPHDVKDGTNLLQAVLSLGFDLPYFCWHPAMHSVGACRQCAVKQFRDEKDTRGRIVMACMTPASDGTRISIDDAEAKAFRASVIEWLMTNHPHDCPVCDEGGECHLQDMTLMSGHNYRRFRFQKRTHRNQYLGPFINHEMNRCITCYRCVRFYHDYAGGDDLAAFAIRNMVYFGRHEDGVLENEFSGNLVEVCPTGVFTDKTYQSHYTRKWDLQSSPSICHHCSLGCNITPGERYGVLRRIRNRYHYDINGYFLCDRGRFGYDFVNAEDRIRRASARGASPVGSITMLSETEALERFKTLIAASKNVAVIGSPRASLETNFAAKTLAASGTYSNGMTRLESRLVKKIASVIASAPGMNATLHDIESSDCVIVLGEDLTNTAPRMALSVRQASRSRVIHNAASLGIPVWNDAAIRQLDPNGKGPVVIASVASTKLDDIADHALTLAPDEIARFGFALAHAADPSAPAVKDLGEEHARMVGSVSSLLGQSAHPVVIAGISQRSEAVIDAAANLARALSVAGKDVHLAFALSDANMMGASFIEGLALDDLLLEASESKPDLLVVCENDIVRRLGRERALALIRSASHVVALDHSETATTAMAELVLPASAFAEASGTLVNNEARAQRFFSTFLPGDDLRESWRWIGSGLSARDPERKRLWNTLDEVIKAMAESVPGLRRIADAAPLSDFRIEGLKIPRETPGFSGRQAMLAHRTIHEPKPPTDVDSPLAFSMEGYPGQPPPSLTPYVWAPGWNSIQALSKYQTEAGGELAGGPAGVRLLEEEGATAASGYAASIPPGASSGGTSMTTVLLYHIFGSEEASARAPGIKERTPSMYCGMNGDDAKARGLEEGATVTLSFTDGRKAALPMRIIPGLPSGLIGIPYGLPDNTLALEEPARVDITKE